jgi:RNA polymerase sigma factor (sigma-70 family)
MGLIEAFPQPRPPAPTSSPRDPARSGGGTELIDGAGRAGYERFYAREVESQVRRAFLLLGSPSLAHDVVADAFIEVYRRWEWIDEPGPYLHRCVLNGCRDAGRRRRRRREVVGASDLAAGRPPAGSIPATGSGSGLGSVELAEALAQLPFRQRAAIVLRYYGRESEREIADRLDCRPGTVGSLIHRGLAALRAELGEERS